MTRKRKTPWQRIRDAANRGTGCRLSADDVDRLAYDNAIMFRAEQDDEQDDSDTAHIEQHKFAPNRNFDCKICGEREQYYHHQENLETRRLKAFWAEDKKEAKMFGQLILDAETNLDCSICGKRYCEHLGNEKEE